MKNPSNLEMKIFPLLMQNSQCNFQEKQKKQTK
jgi:hypothetical protein